MWQRLATALSRGLASLGREAIELVCPPGCAACDRLLATATGQPFCDPCGATLISLAGPGCTRCGLPIAALGRCRSCRRREPAFATICAPFAYGGQLAVAIQRLKYEGRSELAAPLGRLLATTLAACAIDVLLPVPLSPRRLRERGYNQASLLAAAARPADLPLLYRALRRHRDAAPAAALPRAARAASVEDAFELARSVWRQLEGKRIGLLDDVVTTGATANACARVLRDAGAREVIVVALARTLE